MMTDARTNVGCRVTPAKAGDGEALLAAWFAITAGMLWMALWVTRPSEPPAAVSERGRESLVRGPAVADGAMRDLGGIGKEKRL